MQKVNKSLSNMFLQSYVHDYLAISGIVTGSNARCVALMKALKDFVQDYTTPANR